MSVKIVSHKEHITIYPWPREDALLNKLKFRIFESDEYSEDPRHYSALNDFDYSLKKFDPSFKWDHAKIKFKDAVQIPKSSILLTVLVRDPVLCNCVEVFRKEIDSLIETEDLDVLTHKFLRPENGLNFTFNLIPKDEIKTKGVTVENPISVLSSKTYKTSSSDSNSQSTYKITPIDSDAYPTSTDKLLGYWITFYVHDFSNYEKLKNPREVFDIYVNSDINETLIKIPSKYSKGNTKAIGIIWLSPIIEEILTRIISDGTLIEPISSDEGWLPDEINEIIEFYGKSLKEIQASLKSDPGYLRQYVHGHQFKYISEYNNLL